jgi:competence protein ComEA
VITVPAFGQQAEPSPAATSAELEIVNVNTASLEELDTLPGIGPVIGERIIAYRDEHGPFKTVEELTEVEGISDRLLERLRPRITVGD